MKTIYLSITLLVSILMNDFAGDIEIKSIGKLFIKNYPSSVYNGEKQNWDISIGRNGLIYFANGPLLEGGTRYWKLHYFANQIYIRSVYSLPDNSILVGGSHEIGIFKPGDLPGKYNYSSLMPKLDSSFHDFGTVWQIMPYRKSILLRAGKALFSYENDTIKPIIFGKIVDYFNIVNDTIIVRINTEGLGYIGNGNFILFPFGEKFANIKVVSIEKLDDVNMLLFTDDKGVFITDKKSVKPYIPLDKSELKENQISRVCFLDGKYFAVGTVKDGLYIYDLSGSLIQHVNKKNGLQNNTIISMAADSTSNLWLGLDNGISYVELNSCISNISSDIDIGSGYVSKYNKGNLYFGTNQGLYFTKWDTTDPGKNVNYKIQAVKNTSGQVWSLYTHEGVLYCGHHKGLYRIEEDQAKLINSIEGCWQVEALKSNPGYFLESSYRGFFLLKIDASGNLLMSKRLNNISEISPRGLREDSQGFFWVKSNSNKIFRFRFEGESMTVSDIEEMTNYKGLPDYSSLNILGENYQVFFSTNEGIYSFNYKENKFDSNPIYDQVLGKDNLCFEFFEDEYNRTWYANEKEIGYFTFVYGKAEKHYIPFNKILPEQKKMPGSISAIDNEDVFFAVDNGFYHYKSNCSEIQKSNYHVYIASLATAEKPVKWTVSENDETRIPWYNHKKNSFEFTFSSDFFESPENVYYQYFLEGYDDNWSDWTIKNSKEYSNLFEGSYVLKVKARNGFGNENYETRFSFKVLPPFYRSLPAYFVYILIIMGLILLLHKIRLNRIEVEKKKVEVRKQLEIEQKKKKFEEEQLIARQKIGELEKEKLQQDLLHKTKELSNSMINILHKNEIFLGLKDEMQKLYLEKNLSKRDKSIRNLIQTIDSEISSKRDLEIFDSNFSAVHEDFIKKLVNKYPSLNQNDQRLCTFIKMNKTTKEIASLMNMSIRGVETSRYRLRKKLDLDRDANLYDIISEL
ncbi:MAG: hypothetical protein H6538_07120 [Bacteroidales bacterium]|nr:hypothetical protein [Bacteroidales bacterium]MCB9012836.1 hypothetical protein [Bacteroidales bacterium]